ncbi:MAG: Long-chain fatty acid transport protein [Myxococcales bacterium]|nr:Long-chain fatty acid transport protein [Myxococcales bacterium]
MTKTLLALLCLATTASAGGLEVGQQNAVSAGTGGAGAARADDPGAAWHIPAALADGGGLRIGVSLALAHPTLQARATDGAWTSDSDGAWSTPPHLDASVARGRWAAGIALGVPFGGGVRWPAMWPGATESVATQLIVLRAAPFVAWRFGALRISGGIHLDAGRLQIQRNLDFIDTQGDVRLDLDGRGAGLDASAYWQVRPALGLGLVYRGATTLQLAGNANFTAPDAFSGKTPDQTASTTMTMPDTIVLGGSWRRGAIEAVADVAYARWSVNRQTTVSFANDSTPQAVQRNDWHDTVTVRAGGAWTRKALVLRGGMYFDPSPVPADRLSPSSPDANRLSLTAGASYRIAPAWSADLFAEHMWLLRRDATGTETMAASYGGTAIVLGAGVRWTPRR